MENTNQPPAQPQPPQVPNTQTQNFQAQAPQKKSFLKSMMVIVLVLVIAAASGFGMYFVINAQFEKKLSEAVAQNKSLTDQMQILTNQVQSLEEKTKNEASSSANSSTQNASWVNDWIKKEESSPVANPPASLTKCTYKNKTVYYVPSRCCDIRSVLYDDKGEQICSPDGGLTGKGDGKCTDFFEERTDCTTVWKDSRK